MSNSTDLPPQDYNEHQEDESCLLSPKVDVLLPENRTCSQQEEKNKNVCENNGRQSTTTSSFSSSGCGGGGKSTTSPTRTLTTKKQDHHDDNKQPLVVANKSQNDNNPNSSSSSSKNNSTTNNTGSAALVNWVILFLGMCTAGAFLGLGIFSAKSASRDLFIQNAEEIVKSLEKAWEVYVDAASLIHHYCHTRHIISRQDFRDLYEYFLDNGLDFQAMQFDPNVTHAERDEYEQEAKEFYANFYSHIDYRGFVGFNTEADTSLEHRDNASYYFPIHYMEPILGNEAAIDLDYAASGSRRETVLSCMQYGLPALTDRLRLVQETEDIAYGVVLMHPGVNVTDKEYQNPNTTTTTTTTDTQESWPRDLASIVIRIPDLLKLSAFREVAAQVYLYDRKRTIYDDTDQDNNGDEKEAALFLGALRQATLEAMPEIAMDELLKTHKKRYHYTQDIVAANKIWTAVVVSDPGAFEPDLVFIVLGGVVIFLASLGIAGFVYSHHRRLERFSQERARSEQEKASLILDNAKQAAKAERELNDFVSHEVRNPVAAAMAACSFVKTEITKEPPLVTHDSIEIARDDIYTIENALKFVNDLLRNMLDMHRATNKQLKIKMNATDILRDVLEPVDGILYQRGGKTEVIVDCEPNELMVMSDRLRLKQVMLNLGRNAAKFVDDGGFIRLSAWVDEEDGNVKLSCSDSGPGIPPHKRKGLFNKYQESLDVLNQGTGIGLFLCKQLVDLMGGSIYLDESYHSGLEGRPGSRFVIDLDRPPQKFADLEDLCEQTAGNLGDSANGLANDGGRKLPENFSCLFVDDDPILRKLFTRTLKTVTPGWKIQEAGNGEACLRLTETVHFDVVFCDMYMASVEKQMLGTETVEALRQKGFTGCICGLSANDKEQEFLDAGADAFTFKPFPCEPRALRAELYRVLYGHHDNND